MYHHCIAFRLKRKYSNNNIITQLPQHLKQIHDTSYAGEDAQTLSTVLWTCAGQDTQTGTEITEGTFTVSSKTKYIATVKLISSTQRKVKDYALNKTCS